MAGCTHVYKVLPSTHFDMKSKINDIINIIWLLFIVAYFSVFSSEFWPSCISSKSQVCILDYMIKSKPGLLDFKYESK